MHQETNVELGAELEAIATAAAERLRALTAGDARREPDLHRAVSEAANRAIDAGVPLGAMADAERIGQARAREKLGRKGVLRGVERAARGTRDAEHDYDQAVLRAGRLDLARGRCRRRGGA